MAEFVKNRWVLIAGLILFIIAKIPALVLPYYWDESWPYASAITAMYKNGISLLPNAIDTELSRGHPLFFHAAGALWMHIFGRSWVSMHSFALFISVLFLITIYEAGDRIFNKRAAALALILTATSIFFFVQSTFLLFEMLVAFLCFLSIYLYTIKKYLYATLSLTALFLTKESGAIAGFVIGMDALICLFNANEKWRDRLLKLLPVTVACMALGSFLLLQKHYSGWYVLPLYSETILTKWPDIWYRFCFCCVNCIFCRHDEYFIFYLLLLLAIIVVIKKRQRHALALLILIIPTTLAYWFTSEKYWSLFSGWEAIAFCLFIAGYIFSLFSFAAKRYFENAVQRKLILLLGIFILCFLLFSSMAYFIARYELAAIIPLLFLVAVFLEMLTRQSYSKLFYPVVASVFIITAFAFKNDQGIGDCNLGYRNGVRAQLAIVRYMEQNSFYDKKIYFGSFLTYKHLTDPGAGFLSSGRTFKDVTANLNPDTDIAIFDAVETDERRNAILKDTTFELIYHFEKHGVWADIFGKKNLHISHR